MAPYMSLQMKIGVIFVLLGLLGLDLTLGIVPPAIAQSTPLDVNALISRLDDADAPSFSDRVIDQVLALFLVGYS